MDVLAIYVKHDNEAFCEHWRISLHPWWTVIISDDNEALWIYMRLSKVGALGSLCLSFYFFSLAPSTADYTGRKDSTSLSAWYYTSLVTQIQSTHCQHIAYICVFERQRDHGLSETCLSEAFQNCELMLFDVLTMRMGAVGVC